MQATEIEARISFELLLNKRFLEVEKGTLQGSVRERKSFGVHQGQVAFWRFHQSYQKAKSKKGSVYVEISSLLDKISPIF